MIKTLIQLKPLIELFALILQLTIDSYLEYKDKKEREEYREEMLNAKTDPTSAFNNHFN